MSQGLLFFSHFHASLFRKMNSLLYNCSPLHRVNTYTAFYDLESKDIIVVFSPNEMRTLSISCYMFKVLIFIFNMVVKKKFFFSVSDFCLSRCEPGAVRDIWVQDFCMEQLWARIQPGSQDQNKRRPAWGCEPPQVDQSRPSRWRNSLTLEKTCPIKRYEAILKSEKT